MTKELVMIGNTVAVQKNAFPTELHTIQTPEGMLLFPPSSSRSLCRSPGSGSTISQATVMAEYLPCSTACLARSKMFHLEFPRSFLREDMTITIDAARISTLRTPSSADSNKEKKDLKAEAHAK